jgi:hypothetical protein
MNARKLAVRQRFAINLLIRIVGIRIVTIFIPPVDAGIKCFAKGDRRDRRAGCQTLAIVLGIEKLDHIGAGRVGGDTRPVNLLGFQLHKAVHARIILEATQKGRVTQVFVPRIFQETVKVRVHSRPVASTSECRYGARDGSLVVRQPRQKVKRKQATTCE